MKYKDLLKSKKEGIIYIDFSLPLKEEEYQDLIKQIEELDQML